MEFTFAAIDTGITQQEKDQMLAEVLALPEDMHHYNSFRGCRMIGIFNGGGKLGGREVAGNTAKGTFQYTPAGDLCPTIQRVCEEKIFPFMDPIGRVTILRTAPNTGLEVHLDSTPEEIGTLQHKYRTVLNGNIGKLYFLDKDLNKVYVPEYYDTYTMDGSHAHSIDPDPHEKITLCIGAPWKGAATEKYNQLLANAKFSFSVSRPKTLDKWVDPHFKK